MKAYKILLKNEIKLSIRGMDMVIFALCFPIVMLVILGIIYGQKPAYEGADYTFLQQSFGALTTISISAGGVMGLPLVVSEYRSRKILKRFQVTPISPVIILLVELTIYFLYSLISLLTLYAVGGLFFGFEMKGNMLEFLLGWLLVLVSIFSMGLFVGGVAKDSKTAGVIASILYFPMLIFSGATLPYEVMPKLMQKIVGILPLTHGIKILKSVTLGLDVGNVFVPILIMISIAGICIYLGIRYFRWE